MRRAALILALVAALSCAPAALGQDDAVSTPSTAPSAPTAPVWPSARPRGVIYDSADAATLLRDTLGQDDWVQQQPMLRVLDARRQAWKVTTRAATSSTPSLRGLDGPGMADLLQSRITRSAGKLVFIDELDDLAIKTFAPQLAEAMAILRARRTPAGDTYADRVHIYLGPPRLLLADPAGPAWDVLARAGGIWLEAYLSTRAWSEAEWAVWPERVRAGLAARGVGEDRLRLLLTGAGDFAMSARVCAWRNGGVGIYRAGAQMNAFVTGFRAMSNGSAFGCEAPPAPSAEQQADLQALKAAMSGVSLTGGRVMDGRIWAGLPTRVCLTGIDPVFGPATTLRIRGARVIGQATVAAQGPTCVPVMPRRVEQLSLELLAPPERMWEKGVQWGQDLGPLEPAVIHRPSDPRMVAPVRLDRVAQGRLTARPIETPRRLLLSRRGDGWVRAQGRDPQVWAAVAIRVRSAGRTPVPRMTVALMGQKGWRARVRTDLAGQGLAWVRRARVSQVKGSVQRFSAVRARVNIPRPPRRAA